MRTHVVISLIAASLGMAASSPAVLASAVSPGGGSGSLSCPLLSTTCSVSAGSLGTPGSPGSSGGGTTITCTWQPITAAQASGELLPFVPYGQPTPDQSTWSWYIVSCPQDDGYQFLALVYPSPAAAPTPGEVGQLAVSELDLAAPIVSMAPSGGKAIVNLESWLWIDPAQWPPTSATATAGGITATATATPQYVVWDMGDGNSMNCNGPGVAYNTSIPDQDQSTTCGYTYQETSASGPFRITAAIEYDVTWKAVGVVGGGELGDIPGLPTMIPITVDEIGTVTVPNP
jgi:hypothetical protein